MDPTGTGPETGSWTWVWESRPSSEPEAHRGPGETEVGPAKTPEFVPSTRWTRPSGAGGGGGSERTGCRVDPRRALRIRVERRREIHPRRGRYVCWEDPGRSQNNLRSLSAKSYTGFSLCARVGRWTLGVAHTRTSSLTRTRDRDRGTTGNRHWGTSRLRLVGMSSECRWTPLPENLKRHKTSDWLGLRSWSHEYRH